MKRLATILGIFTLFLVTFAQAQQRWTRTYGGTLNEEGYSGQQTSDGGYIVAGYTRSFGAGSDDVWLIKTNAFGDTLWTRTYGGAGEEEGNSVQQTSDMGYIVAGYTRSFGDTTQVYLIKTNASGDTLWTRTYGGANWDDGYFVRQTSDGGYIIAGYSNSFGTGIDEVYLIKTNASGDTLWTRTYGRGTSDYAYSVQQTSDGGYIVAGQSWSGGSYDAWLIKTNSSGDTLWTRAYGGANGDYGTSVQQTPDMGYIVAGFTASYGAGGADVWLIKTNASGDTLWTRTYGGANGDYGYSVQQTQDGGYIVAGYTQSFGAGGFDVYLVKTNASGDTLWTRTYGGAGGDFGDVTQQTSDGGYIISGTTNSFGAGAYDVYLIKTDGNGNVGVETPVRQLDGSTVRQLKATPNPFTSFATLPGHEAKHFDLYDISGRKVGAYRGDRIGDKLIPGVYFLRPENGSARPIRVVKVR
jgi:hypothetical protein